MTGQAQCYCRLGDNKKAIELGSHAADILRAKKGEYNSDYAESLCNLALYYYLYGDYKKADYCAAKALQIQKKIMVTIIQSVLIRYTH